MPSSALPIAPVSLSQAAFVQQFGGIYEHSPWVAEAAWEQGLSDAHTEIATFAELLRGIVDAAPLTQRRALINAHPDLAGKAAVAGELTADSTSEQSSAGLDQCTPAEFERFTTLNTAYRERFDMPFIMAVRGSNRHLILAAFEARIDHTPAEEFTTAMHEIHKIARLRLENLTVG
ncbi:MAG: 2-oxo-4-hydroxy-4-carboxy-5-ureidoimidazoline decarboxylase [Pseudomonadota bacterium]